MHALFFAKEQSRKKRGGKHGSKKEEPVGLHGEKRGERAEEKGGGGERGDAEGALALLSFCKTLVECLHQRHGTDGSAAQKPRKDRRTASLTDAEQAAQRAGQTAKKAHEGG